MGIWGLQQETTEPPTVTFSLHDPFYLRLNFGLGQAGFLKFCINCFSAVKTRKPQTGHVAFQSPSLVVIASGFRLCSWSVYDMASGVTLMDRLPGKLFSLWA
jgi:hypothetical protein